jgi:hypothetical protein
MEGPGTPQGGSGWVGQEGLNAGDGYGVYRHGGRGKLTFGGAPKNKLPLEATVIAGADGPQ